MDFRSGQSNVGGDPQSGLDQSHVSSTGGFRGRFWMKPVQIFTDVSATVAENFLELAVDRRQDDFFGKLKSEIGVQFDNERNVIRGNLEQIILTKMRMEKYVTELEETELRHSSWNLHPIDEMIEEPNKRMAAIKREIESSEEEEEEKERYEKNPSYDRLEQSLDLAVVPNEKPTATSKSRRKVRAPRKLTSNSDSNKIFMEQMDNELPIDMMTMIRFSPSKDVMTTDDATSLNAVSNSYSTENIAAAVVKVECVETMDSINSHELFSKSSPKWQMEDSTKPKDLSFDSASKDTSFEKLRDSGSPFEYSCELCSFKTLKEGQLLKHVLIHGKSNIMHSCDKCSFISVSLSHFKRHLLCHSENVFKCPECKFETDEARQLTRHVTMKHSSCHIPPLPREDTASILQCSECSYNTTKIYHFERHLLVHNRDLQCLLQVYQCDECPYKTHRKEHYHRHRNSVHVRSRPYQCNYCRRSYKTSSALREHDLAAHNKGFGQGFNITGHLGPPVSHFGGLVVAKSDASDILTE